MPLPYNAKNKNFARNMRKNATKQENHLWYDFLRKYPVQFCRQVMIDDFIADFYCHKAKLVIELDGSQHETDEGVQSVVVVCEGANNLQVVIDVREAVASAVGTQEKNVKIYLKKGD